MDRRLENTYFREGELCQSERADGESRATGFLGGRTNRNKELGRMTPVAESMNPLRLPVRRGYLDSDGAPPGRSHRDRQNQARPSHIPLKSWKKAHSAPGIECRVQCQVRSQTVDDTPNGVPACLG